MEAENINNAQSPALQQGVVSGSCNCVECGKEFQPYNWADDCYPCNGDGEYEMEMEWEYEPSMHRCPFCNGVGAIKYVESKKCKECKKMAEMEDEYDEADDDYCPSCCRHCNCR